MIENYFKFDVEKFFGDYEFNKKMRDKLQTEKNEELTNSSTSFSAARVSRRNISNPTEKKVKRRLSIDEKIQGLEEYFSAYDYIMSQLTDEEKLIVKKVLVYPKTNRQRRIMEIQETLHMEQASIYRKKREIKSKIEKMADWI